MAKLHCAMFYYFEGENESVILIPSATYQSAWRHVPRLCRLSPFSRGQSQFPPIRISSPVHNVHAARFMGIITFVGVIASPSTQDLKSVKVESRLDVSACIRYKIKIRNYYNGNLRLPAVTN